MNTGKKTNTVKLSELVKDATQSVKNKSVRGYETKASCDVTVGDYVIRENRFCLVTEG